MRIASRPDRILSLSASATQMLYEIGAGSQVVGVDKYSAWPANAPRTKFTGYESSAEDYLYLKPDLVIFAFSSATLIEQLQKLQIPVLVIPPATTIANVDSQLAELGDGDRAPNRCKKRSVFVCGRHRLRRPQRQRRRPRRDLLHRARPDQLLHRDLGHLYRG